jgi:hypothetical protein
MKTITYRVAVDGDVGYPLAKFTEEVQIYLADPYGWEAHGYTFVYSPKGNIIIKLSSKETLAKSGCYDGRLSCADMGGIHMNINADRWIHGSSKSKLDLEDYRQYVISHEMGHILGHDHVKCSKKGAPAPIMMQQTLGIGECVPNTHV